MITERVSDPITSSNITGWLRNQMVTNAQSQVVQNIQENWHSWNPINKDAALQAWVALVGTGATWDFKVDIERTTWFANGERNVTLGNRELNFDAGANIHFGFVGRAAGFSEEFLAAAAGLAQFQTYQANPVPLNQGVCDTNSYCDQPFATWSIRFGSYLYDLYGDRLDELDDDAFANTLEDYIEEYGEPPDPPGS